MVSALPYSRQWVVVVGINDVVGRVARSDGMVSSIGPKLLPVWHPLQAWVSGVDAANGCGVWGIILEPGLIVQNRDPPVKTQESIPPPGVREARLD